MYSIALTLVLLVAIPVQAADKMTIILDWFINPDHGPIIVAKEKEYFKDVGLVLEIIAPPPFLPWALGYG